MVRIPTMDNYGITGVNTQQAYSNAQARPQAFGAGVGVATQNLAGEIRQAVNVASKIKTELSTLAVENKYNNETSIAFRDLDKEYTQMMGKNAIDGYEGMMQRLEDTKVKALEGITDPQEKMMMEQFITRRATQSQDYWSRHLNQQVGIYKEDTFTSSRAMTVRNGVDFAGDPKIFDQYRRTNEHLIEDYGLENGWASEKIEMEKRKDRDALVSSSVQWLIQQSPQQAMAFLKQHQEQISPEIAGKARKMLDPYYEQMAVSEFLAGAGAGRVNPDSMVDIKKPTVTPPAQIKTILDEASRRHGVPSSLVYAVAYNESTYNPNAKSSAGAVGLMQLMPETAQDLGISPEERTDPIKSADGGTRYLAQMLTKYDNNPILALGAYNAGPGNMDKAIQRAGKGASGMEVLQNLSPKAQKETIPYVQRILNMVEGGEPPQQQPVAQPQTEEELESWRSAMTSQAGGMYRKEKIAAVNAQYAEMKQAMKARNDGADRIITSGVVRQIEEKGAVNLTELKQNPQIAQALEYATPSFILSLTEKEQTARAKREQEVTKQEEESAKTASERVYMSRYGSLMTNVDFAKSYNPAKDPELTPSQMEKLWSLKEDIAKRGEKQIANDPLHTNLKQGIDIFEDVYKASSGKTLDREYKISKNYLFLQGVTTEAIVQAQLMNGGKVLSAEEQRKIAERVFVKNVSQGTKNVEDVYEELKKRFPTATETQLQAGTANALRFMDSTGANLKKTLQQGMN